MLAKFTQGFIEGVQAALWMIPQVLGVLVVVLPIVFLGAASLIRIFSGEWPWKLDAED